YRARPATELLRVVPEDFPCAVADHRYDRHLRIDGQFEWTALEAVSVGRKLLADMSFGADDHAPSVPSVAISAFACLEGRNVTSPIQRNVDCPKKKTRYRIIEQFDFPHE